MSQLGCARCLACACLRHKADGSALGKLPENSSQRVVLMRAQSFKAKPSSSLWKWCPKLINLQSHFPKAILSPNPCLLVANSPTRAFSSSSLLEANEFRQQQRHADCDKVEKSDQDIDGSAPRQTRKLRVHAETVVARTRHSGCQRFLQLQIYWAKALTQVTHHGVFAGLLKVLSYHHQCNTALDLQEGNIHVQTVEASESQNGTPAPLRRTWASKCHQATG